MDYECSNRYCSRAPQFADLLGGHASGAHGVIRALVEAGVTTLQQVHAMTNKDLAEIPGVGQQTIKRLRGSAPVGVFLDYRLPLPRHVMLTFEDSHVGGGLVDRPQFAVAIQKPGTFILTLRGTFGSPVAAARWAAGNVPEGHMWAIAPIGGVRRARSEHPPEK